MMRGAAILVTCLAAATILPEAAAAHPHVWIVARSEIALDAERRLVGIRHNWTFDLAYSAFATLNLGTRQDPSPPPDKLADLASTQLASLASYAYFTVGKANGMPLAFGPPREARLDYAAGRLTLRFFLPIRQPVKLGLVSLQTYDETFFVAFNWPRDDDAVKIVGPTGGCVLRVTRPKVDADEGLQIIPDAEAASLDKASQAASDFRTNLLVVCP